MTLPARSAVGTTRWYRLRFSKLGKIRFTSHRDVARMWERALRRARLPVALTMGFRPRPRLSFGLALSTGHESMAEYLDVELIEPSDGGAPLDAADLADRLSCELPAGIDVLAAAVLDPGQPSLQEAVRSCSWLIEAVDVEPERADRMISAALGAGELIVSRQRKGREVIDDLRPAILSVSVVGPTPAGTELEAELAVHPRSVRPTELLAALGPGLIEGPVCRTAQWIWRDGVREEPLLAAADRPASRAPHTAACATRRDQLDVRQRTREATSPASLEPSSPSAVALARGAPASGA